MIGENDKCRYVILCEDGDGIFVDFADFKKQALELAHEHAEYFPTVYILKVAEWIGSGF